MDLDTYDGLKEAIADALMRDDLTSQIPLFIKLCESSNARNLRISEMETIATATLVDGEVALPSDFIEVIDLRGDNLYQSWTPITPYQAQRDYPTGTGIPGHYTVIGNTLRTYPGGGEDDVILTYYAKPQALDAGNQTNWLLTKAPDVYLYGSLKHSAPWLEDDARIQVWESLYQQALTEVRRTDEIRAGNMISTVYVAHEQ
jgi:hypothetical protein